MASEDDADTEEALKEFDFLVTAEDGEGAGEARSSGDGTEWGETAGRFGCLSFAAFTPNVEPRNKNPAELCDRETLSQLT